MPIPLIIMARYIKPVILIITGCPIRSLTSGFDRRTGHLKNILAGQQKVLTENGDHEVENIDS